jgi:hypothetical protein
LERLSYISPKAKVAPSLIHGRGLFAVAPVARGEVVCVKGGHVFDRRRLEELQPRLGPAEIQIGENLFIGPIADEEREGSMIFSNHSCEPNIAVRGEITFVALRDIAAGEELTHDWATTDDDGYEMECRCGSPSCRGRVTGQDWRRPDLQERYGRHFSSYLLEKIERLREGNATGAPRT